MLYTIFLEFGGLLLFSILTGLLVTMVSVGGDFLSMLSEYMETVQIWVLKLEKANDNRRVDHMPAELY